MNYKKACNILNLDEYREHDISVVKKKYHILALRYHPDKNKSEDADDKFREISDAYQFLSKSETKMQPYEVFVKFFMGTLEQDEQQEYIHMLLEKVLCICEKQAMQIIESMEYEKFILIYNLIKRYKHLFHFSPEFTSFMEKRAILMFSQGSLKERRLREIIPDLSEPNSQKRKQTIVNTEWNMKYEVDINEEDHENDVTADIMILRPTLDDVIIDNVYQYIRNDNRVLIPLWHHEIEYDISGTFIVKVNPKLPSMNYWIDEENNLHQRVEYTLSELWDCVIEEKPMEIYFGKKRFVFYPNELQLKMYQIWTWKNEGISKINKRNTYDVSIRANVILHIHISGIL
jgi:hypothetical protein